MCGPDPSRVERSLRATIVAAGEVRRTNFPPLAKGKYRGVVGREVNIDPTEEDIILVPDEADEQPAESVDEESDPSESEE